MIKHLRTFALIAVTLATAIGGAILGYKLFFARHVPEKRHPGAAMFSISPGGRVRASAASVVLLHQVPSSDKAVVLLTAEMPNGWLYGQIQLCHLSNDGEQVPQFGDPLIWCDVPIADLPRVLAFGIPSEVIKEMLVVAESNQWVPIVSNQRRPIVVAWPRQNAASQPSGSLDVTDGKPDT